MIQRYAEGWRRFWALSWWWKGPTLGVTAFIVLIVGIAVASGGEGDTEGQEPTPTATNVTPTSIPSPTVIPTEIPTPEPTPAPSPTPETTPTPEPTEPPTPTLAPTPAPTTPPAPEPTPTTPPQANCHESYPDFCIPPPPPDKNCPDFTQKNITVKHDVSNPDPHKLDGDKDGIACEG